MTCRGYAMTRRFANAPLHAMLSRDVMKAILAPLARNAAKVIARYHVTPSTIARAAMFVTLTGTARFLAMRLATVRLDLRAAEVYASQTLASSLRSATAMKTAESAAFATIQLAPALKNLPARR
jgi:hypothetical protein